MQWLKRRQHETAGQKYDLKYMKTKQEKMGHIFKEIEL